MPRGSKDLTVRREQQAWELRLRGYSQTRIANELGVDQSAVSLMLQRVRKRAYAELSKDVQENKATQTLQLEHFITEAMDAWERSKLDAESIETTEEQTVIKVPGGAGSESREIPATEVKVKRTSRGQVGDPRFLDGAMKALSDIRDIWGIEAPKRTDLTSDGKPVQPVVREVVIVRTRSAESLEVVGHASPGQPNGHRVIDVTPRNGDP